MGFDPENLSLKRIYNGTNTAGKTSWLMKVELDIVNLIFTPRDKNHIENSMYFKDE